MARTRNLKPSFFTNEQLADLPPLTRLFFQGLWTQADREGRLEDRPRKLKAEILPYDDCNGEEMMAQLSEAGFVERYEVGDKKYVAIPTFRKHQTPHPKEPTSVIPLKPEQTKKVASRRHVIDKVLPKGDPSPGSVIDPVCDEPQSDHANTLTLSHANTLTTNTLGGESNKEVESGTVLSGKPDDGPPKKFSAAREVFEDWKEVHDHPRAVFDDKRRDLINTRLKRFSVADLKLASRGCKKSPFHQGQNEHGTVYDSIELILRNTEHIEKFMAFATGEATVEASPKRFLTETEKLAQGDALYASYGAN